MRLSGKTTPHVEWHVKEARILERQLEKEIARIKDLPIANLSDPFILAAIEGVNEARRNLDNAYRRVALAVMDSMETRTDNDLMDDMREKLSNENRSL